MRERSRYAGGMKIGKPLLLVITPLGVAGGLYEAYHLAGGLVLLMAALVGMLCAAFAQVVYTIRQERRAGGGPGTTGDSPGRE